MRIIYWTIRIYWIFALIWAISSWIGGLPHPAGTWLNWLMWPIRAPLGFLHLGGLWIGPMLMLMLLWGLDAWVTKTLNSRQANVGAYTTSDDD